MEKSIIGDEVVLAIAHDRAKCPSSKSVQTAALVDFNALSFTAIPPSTTVKGIYHGGRYSQTSIEIR